MLVVDDLKVSLSKKSGSIPIVKGISFDIAEGECFGLVGESGSGKSLSALSIIRLLSKNLIAHAGNMSFAGKDLQAVTSKEYRKIRGKDISMIFQEPMTSLNPVFTIGDQLSEVFEIHQGVQRSVAIKLSEEILDAVKIPNVKGCLSNYPGQLSGGMRQRVMIAMALACKPKLLIADEPTTALDVTIQAQVLSLIQELSKEFGTSVLFITHDLAVIAEMCNRVAVLYGGKIVENGLVEKIIKRPHHPYTKGLLGSLPVMGVTGKNARLQTIQGTVPSAGKFPSGCQFSDRCPVARKSCSLESPKEYEEDGRKVACSFPLKGDI